MNYSLEILLKCNNVKISITDRNDNSIEYKKTSHGEFEKLSMNISMPNRIWLHLLRTEPDGYVELASVWLGQIKFNSNALEHFIAYYCGNRITKTTQFTQTGKVELQLFDHNPILFHLHLNSKI